MGEDGTMEKPGPGAGREDGEGLHRVRRALVSGRSAAGIRTGRGVSTREKSEAQVEHVDSFMVRGPKRLGLRHRQPGEVGMVGAADRA